VSSLVLYGIYRSAYVESSHFESAEPGDPGPVARRIREFVRAERAIAELGRHDATDGRPMRSLHEFERALLHGRTALGVAAPTLA
jgi:hypothetical protein